MKEDKSEEIVNCEDNEEKAEPTRSWRLIGVVGFLLAATAVIANLHDIKRYIRISTM